MKIQGKNVPENVQNFNSLKARIVYTNILRILQVTFDY